MVTERDKHIYGKAEPVGSFGTIEAAQKFAERGCATGQVELLGLPEGLLVYFELYEREKRAQGRGLTTIVRNPRRGLFEVRFDTKFWDPAHTAEATFEGGSLIEIIGSVKDNTRPFENDNFTDGKAVQAQHLVVVKNDLGVAMPEPLGQIHLGQVRALPYIART